MSIEELISVSEEHSYDYHDVIKQLKLRLNCVLNLNTPDLVVKYLYEYYLDSLPDIPPQFIIDCIFKCFSSTELYSVLHYLMDGYLEELDKAASPDIDGY